MNKKIWVSYMDEVGNKINGYFNLIELSENFIIIRSKKSNLLIPFHKINKIKMKGGSKI